MGTRHFAGPQAGLLGDRVYLRDPLDPFPASGILWYTMRERAPRGPRWGGAGEWPRRHAENLLRQVAEDAASRIALARGADELDALARSPIANLGGVEEWWALERFTAHALVGSTFNTKRHAGVEFVPERVVARFAREVARRWIAGERSPEGAIRITFTK